MALDNYKGELVLSGTWLYAGTQRRAIAIIARNYDAEFSAYASDGLLEPDDQPKPLGPEGKLYYVQGTSDKGHPTLDEAKAWADAQPWGPVTWDGAIHPNFPA